MSEQARRVTLAVSIAGHDAAGAMAPYLLDFEFTDNAHGKADEVQISLHNRDGRWSGPWKPSKGMPVSATIICHDWEGPGQTLSLPCGSFKIDEIEFSGPPDKVSIKAVSSTLTTAFRDTKKTRAWENTTFQAVAGQIAGENGLSLMYYGPAYGFARKDQRNESDLAFVFRLAHERAMNCKTHDGKLILFDAESAEAQGPMMSIPRTGSMYSPKSYNFKDASADTRYTDGEAAYTDPIKGETHTATTRANVGQGTGGKTLTIQQRAESAGEAMALSRAALHQANMEEQTGSLECTGCPRLVAGRTIELVDFGAFSGPYFIRTASHRLGGSQGYTTSLELTTGASTSGISAVDVV